MSTPQTTTELPTGTWQLDPEQTSVTVTARKLGLFKVPASLSVISGVIEISADHQVTSAHVVLDAASYESANAKRNEHVRGADFLDAAAHPTLEFRTARAKPSGAGYAAHGTATAKGVSAAVSLEISDVQVDGEAATFAASTTLDRKAVGVDKLPALIIGSDIEISVVAHAVRAGTGSGASA